MKMQERKLDLEILYQQIHQDIHSANIENLKRHLASLVDSDINLLTSKYELSPLHLVSLADTDERTKIIMATLLIDYDVDVNAIAIDPRSNDYWPESKQLITPLDLIDAAKNQTKLKNLIIEHGGISLYQKFHQQYHLRGNPGDVLIKKVKPDTATQIEDFIIKNRINYQLMFSPTQKIPALGDIELVKLENTFCHNPKINFRYQSFTGEVHDIILEWEKLMYMPSWYLFAKKESRNIAYILEHDDLFLPIFLDVIKTNDQLADHLAQFINSSIDEAELKDLLSGPILNASDVQTILDITKGRRRLFFELEEGASHHWQCVKLKDILTVKSLLLLSGSVDLVRKYFNDIPMLRDGAIMWFADKLSNLPDVLLYAIYLKQAEAVKYLLFEEGNGRHDVENMFACALEMFDYQVIDVLINYCIKYHIDLDLNKPCLKYYKDNNENDKLQYLVSLFNLKNEHYCFLDSDNLEQQLRNLDPEKSLFILKVTAIDLSKKDANGNNVLHSVAQNITKDTKDLFLEILAFIHCRDKHPMLYLEKNGQNTQLNLLNQLNHDNKNVAQLIVLNEKLSPKAKQKLLFSLMTYYAHIPKDIYHECLLTPHDFYHACQLQQDQLTQHIRLIARDNKKLQKYVFAMRAGLFPPRNMSFETLEHPTTLLMKK